VFRRLDDFATMWAQERESTLKVFGALTEPSLAQAVEPGGRTLGRLAWHIVLTIPEMLSHSGLEVAGPSESTPQPPLADIVRTYASASARVPAAVAAQWTDALLGESIPMYGEHWPRGLVLSALIAHQTHHRGQMTVLMRQAGLAVPGVYGPSREEWAAMNLPAQE
jgi:uncharacterized damage-inducible protein DinB